MSKAITWSQLPQGMPNGDILPHVSAKMRTNLIDQTFFHIGGPERFADWADHNPDEFYKMWGRGAVRSSNVEVGLSEGIENLLDQLDQAEKANTIEGEYVAWPVKDQDPEPA